MQFMRAIYQFQQPLKKILLPKANAVCPCFHDFYQNYLCNSKLIDGDSNDPKQDSNEIDDNNM